MLIAAAALAAAAAHADDVLSDFDRPLRGPRHSCDDRPTPYSDFEPLATSLGATVAKRGCRYGIKELAELVQKEDPRQDHAGDWACVMLDDNLSREVQQGCQPPAEAAYRAALRMPAYIHGRLAYVGIWQSKYRYLLSPGPDGSIKVGVRVAFKNDLIKDPEIRKDLEVKLARAAQLWTEHSPGGKMHFDFRIASVGDDSAIPVNLTKNPTRGPYNVEWSAGWGWHTIAHESGHFMGLDDEYDQLRVTFDMGKTQMDMDHCEPTSIMCSSGSENAVPQPYHYYLILRRILCPWLGNAFDIPV